MKIDTRAIIGVLVIIFVLALGYSTFSNYIIEYKTVSEAAGGNSTGMIWVNGTILKGSLTSLNTGEINFVLTDGVSMINVTFAGELPSSLGADAEIIVYGMFGENKFNAAKMISRCPTKYQG